MRSVSILAVTLAALVWALAGGCMIADRPALTADEAEDVGPLLEYRVIVPEGDAVYFRFERGPGNRYAMFLVSAEGKLPLGGSAEARALIRRVDGRGNDPAFLIQFDIDPPETTPPSGGARMVGLVALRPDGVGVHGVLEGNDPATAELARSHGFSLHPDPDLVHLPALQADTPSADLLGLVAALRGQGLIGWEDELGISLFTEITQEL